MTSSYFLPSYSSPYSFASSLLWSSSTKSEKEKEEFRLRPQWNASTLQERLDAAASAKPEPDVVTAKPAAESDDPDSNLSCSVSRHSVTASCSTTPLSVAAVALRLTPPSLRSFSSSVLGSTSSSKKSRAAVTHEKTQDSPFERARVVFIDRKTVQKALLGVMPPPDYEDHKRHTTTESGGGDDDDDNRIARIYECSDGFRGSFADVLCREMGLEVAKRQAMIKEVAAAAAPLWNVKLDDSLGTVQTICGEWRRTSNQRASSSSSSSSSSLLSSSLPLPPPPPPPPPPPKPLSQTADRPATAVLEFEDEGDSDEDVFYEAIAKNISDSEDSALDDDGHEFDSSSDTDDAKSLFPVADDDGAVKAKEKARALNLFRGKWRKDMERSSDQDALLRALGVPWLARTAVARCQQTTDIDITGPFLLSSVADPSDHPPSSELEEPASPVVVVVGPEEEEDEPTTPYEWTEKQVSVAVFTNDQVMLLNGEQLDKTNPLDNSLVSTMSFVQKRKGGHSAAAVHVSSHSVITELNYPDKKCSQIITRMIESSVRDLSLHGRRSGDDVYHVRNVLTTKDGKIIEVSSYFNRIDSE